MRLEELPLWCRLCLIAVAIALGIILTEVDKGSKAEGPIAPSVYDARIIELEKMALDTAYQEQITHLFQVWMRDDRGQPQRALVGARQAQRAYIDAISGIEARAKALKEN